MNYLVGQKLLCGTIGENAPPLFEVTITKVGRRWLYLDEDHLYRGWRADATTLKLDADYSRALWTRPSGYACFTSADAYEAAIAAHKADIARRTAWDELRSAIYSRCPEGLDADDIYAAMALLGLTPANSLDRP